MPKIHIIGSPLDLYRFKTFIEVLIDNKKDWGISLDYNSLVSRQRKRNYFVQKLNTLIKLSLSTYNIWKADYVYFPPMVLGLDLSSKIIIKITDILKKKVIFDYYISLYDTWVLDRRKIKADSKEAKALSTLDNWGHTRWRTIYLNPCEAKRYRGLNNLGIEKNVRIIPLSINKRPEASLNYFKHDGQTCFNMVWWGTYIPLHGLKKIIEATNILVKRHKNVHLFILGNNDELSKEYQTMVDSIEGLSSFVTISNNMTFSNGKLLPFLQQNCDLAFGAFGESEKAKTVILNKAIEAVALKIPVITQVSEAFEDYFPSDSTIFYCKNDPELMADKIMEIMGTPKDQLMARLSESMNVYNENFSIDASKKKFEKLLSELNDQCR